MPEQKSGQIRITNDGKVILTGEIFDQHGSYPFEAFIDTGSSFGLIITQELADAVCAPVLEEVNICIGAGSGNTKGHTRLANFRFGDLEIKNYRATAVKGSRNLVGVKFFQDISAAVLLDFHQGKTAGCFLSTDQKFVRMLGKSLHCATVHGLDICESTKPCPVCGQMGR